MMKQVQKMQADMLAAQEALAAMEVEGSAGGGMVKAVVTGGGELRSVSASRPTWWTPTTSRCSRTSSSPRSTEAMRASQELQSEQMGGVTGGLDLSAFGLG